MFDTTLSTSYFLLVMTVMIVVCQSPIILRDMHMRFMATKRHPHLGTGRKGVRKRKGKKLSTQVQFLYVVMEIIYDIHAI